MRYGRNGNSNYSGVQSNLDNANIERTKHRVSQGYNVAIKVTVSYKVFFKSKMAKA